MSLAALLRCVVDLAAAAVRRAGAAVRPAAQRGVRSAALPKALAALAMLAGGLAPAPAPGPQTPGRLAAAASAHLVAQRDGPLPLVGSSRPGRAGAEATALGLVELLRGVPTTGAAGAGDIVLDATGFSAAGTCPPSRLVVSWSVPVGPYQIGGFARPLGPPPDAASTHANGVVLCRGSSYAFVGFEASWDGRRWSAEPVPASADIDLPPPAAEVAAVGPSPQQALTNPPPGTSDAPSLGAVSHPAGGFGPAIEGLAPYVPQSTCDPSPKPGVLGFRDLVLRAFPTSRNLGIGRECDSEAGVTEHKEGRAFDWGVRADDPAERATADQLLGWLFAPDAFGNSGAMLRRLGVMYVIWDHHIWGAYRAAEGWRAYDGPNPHTDHIHLSFSWPGALAQTSFWTGRVVDVDAGAPPGRALFALPGAVGRGPATIATAVGAAAAPAPGPAAGPAPAPAPAAPPGGSTPTTAAPARPSPTTTSSSTTTPNTTTPSTTTTTASVPSPIPVPTTTPDGAIPHAAAARPLSAP